METDERYTDRMAALSRRSSHLNRKPREIFRRIVERFNSDGGYRITNTEQIDFHTGFCLNRNAPTYFRRRLLVSRRWPVLSG
jgi:hypothetical protein